MSATEIPALAGPRGSWGRRGAATITPYGPFGTAGDGPVLLAIQNEREWTEPVMNPVPAVGQHTDAILRDLGRTGGDIAALRAGGVI